MEKAELQNFKNSVFERFCNPFIDHKLLDISLNSVSKFRARCLGSILQYTDIFGTAPDLLSFAFAALIKFYDGKFMPMVILLQNLIIQNIAFEILKKFCAGLNTLIKPMILFMKY